MQCLPLIGKTCECEHLYSADIIAQIDAEGDTYSDDYLYEKENHKTQMIDPGPKPEKILQQAAYAFDSFRYKKCLEKIKEYERANYPPPYDYPSQEEKLTILAYKAYCNRFLKKYDSAITYFEEMIDIIKRTDYLTPECKFITYLEHAQCYLLKGDKNEFKNRVKKIIDLGIAPKYEYYLKNDFKIHHQPCFHKHELNYHDLIVFKEVATKVLGEELYAMMEQKDQIPKIRTIAHHTGDTEFCRRMCTRATYISAIIAGCISRAPQAVGAIIILSELFIDCELCCKDGWSSKNCLQELKWIIDKICNQNLLDGL